MSSATTEPSLTPRRRAVLDAVRESEGHLSASEIWERARAAEPRISFATVYNAVHYLCDRGLLVEIPFGDGASLYDARTDHHDHVVCSCCGRMVDCHLGHEQRISKEAADLTGYDIHEVRVLLTGVCPKCRPGVKADD